MTSSLLSQTYTFDPRPYYPLVSTVKRYWRPIFEEPDGLTLVFAHAAGFHKEIWEPTIDDLLQIIDQAYSMDAGSKTKIRIRELWTIDAPNCGDAALLNEEMLKWGYEVFPFQEYARSIHAFLTGQGRTHTGYNLHTSSIVPNTDFTSRKLVGIGHSMGGSSFLLSLDFFSPIERLFTSIILIEPVAINKQATLSMTDIFSKAARSRKDRWPSREDAHNMIRASARLGKYWDERVLRIYVNQGLRPLPTLEYPDLKDGVTLKCTRKQETAIYLGLSIGSSVVFRGISTYASRVRIHLVYGKVDDVLPLATKSEMAQKDSRGQPNLASFGFMEGAGHYAPHSHPRELAERILQMLDSDVESQNLGTKL
ncbi:hypothetical protein GYMLUDRAFT_709378 [Collybiopsis luxurians FD-317 M1]|nr:hypothetical protein GYMLUDRAFT_709378 [Collybiopsis luxurians FD-317 M1]